MDLYLAQEGHEDSKISGIVFHYEYFWNINKHISSPSSSFGSLWLAIDRWFLLGYKNTNKSDGKCKAEILLKVALNNNYSYAYIRHTGWLGLWVLSRHLNPISVVSRVSILLMDETGVYREYHVICVKVRTNFTT